MPSKPRLFLHIGTHKTGTTSIQRFCAANREALADAGLLYPSFGLGGYPGHYAHHRLAHATAGKDDIMDVSHVKHFLGVVRDKMDPAQSVLISAEPYYRHRVRNDEGVNSISDYVTLVGETYEDFDVTVVVMLRRQDLMLEALYAEHVMATAYTDTIATFRKTHGHLLDYRGRLHDWADVFGRENIWVRAFEPSLTGQRIEREFLEWLGIEWRDTFDLGRRRNVTPGRAFVEFKRMMNVPTQRRRANTSLRSWVEKLASTKPDAAPDLGAYYLNPEQRLEVLSAYNEDNKVVAQTYLGTDTLFRLPVETDIEKYAGDLQLSERDALAMARDLVQLIARSHRS